MQPVYVACPTYETDHFSLRLVKEEDAADLLACYSDRAAVAVMNSDNCTSDFYYASLAEMQGCIRMWLGEYAHGAYVRFSIVEKASAKAVGTVEVFGGECGVLRIDIVPALERRAYLGEILALAVKHFYDNFDAQKIAVKALPAATERIAALAAWGFAPDESFRPGLCYYSRTR
jgi:ribosomal-protein-alanine N-acetyltransferase